MRNAKFWVALGAVELLFGLAIFGITRQYYLHDAGTVRVDSERASTPVLVWPEGVTEENLSQFAPATSGPSLMDDPIEISRQADDSFNARQYEKAASLYERLLAFGPNNVDVYNNLGLTLHYLGRSTEALGRLNEGVAVDPANQRIWLTLGFVNSQLGNVEEARKALTTASEIGDDVDIRQSALKMLEELP